MTKIDPYASGALKPGPHDRLVADLDRYARDAGIHPKWIMTPLPDVVNDKVFQWVMAFRKHETSGLCLTGDLSKADDAVSAIAGALTRNFILGQVYTLNQAIEATQDGSIGDPSCLLIPNFFVGKAAGASMVDWRLQILYDTLYSRNLVRRRTVVYVSNLKDMGEQYGPTYKNLIENNYDVISL